MLAPAQLSSFRSRLLSWYDAHRRKLPWRRDRDPYRVWVSEIMLQQTRVAAVLEHYARFMARLPTVEKLAAAREQTVLALWSGLGYYHRARRMHQAAKTIVRQQGSRFPSRVEDWRKLPGIGRYTAAAIASIACNEAIAVLDGNVERVLGRLYGNGANDGENWKRAQALLDRKRPGDFNQAMMELGATVCTPKSPQCLVCPVHNWCCTHGEEPRQAQPTRKKKRLYYALVRKGASVLLMQRDKEARLMPGMWELPEMPGPSNGAVPVMSLRHSITNTDYEVKVFAGATAAQTGRWFTLEQCRRLPLTGLARKILRSLS
jgi:A/G-specific adenine glycosylase